MGLRTVEFESGYLILVQDGGQKTRYPIADVVRVLDIPTGLDQTQVKGLTTLASLVAVLVRTLIDNETLGESFLEDGSYDIGDIIESIEGLGTDYGNPDIGVEE